MLYQKAAGKAVQIGLHIACPRRRPRPMKTRTPRGAPLHPPRPRATPPPHRYRQLGRLGVLGAIRAMDGRKPLVPSSGLAMQIGTERRIFYASQLAEGLVKELDCPILWFVLGLKEGSNLGPKEGSNCHEGREKRHEVPGHNWHFRHFHPRFRFRKGAVKRAEQEGLDAVQGGNSEFIPCYVSRSRYIACKHSPSNKTKAV